MKKKILLLALMLIGSSISIFAQTKTLTREEFFKPIRNADDLKLDTSHREKMSYKSYIGNEVNYSLSEINEYLLPDKERHLSIESTNGKSEKIETIIVNETIYQRINDGKWIIEETFYGGGDRSIGMPLSQEYSVEETTLNNKPVKLYVWLVINSGNAEKTEENKTYHEIKYWIDTKGFLLKREEIYGNLKTKSVRSHRVQEFEYSPKDLVIKAPKIKNKK